MDHGSKQYGRLDKMELAILIPARNEMFLSRTVEDILQHSEADTEILVGLDGEWADPVIKDHSRLTLLHVSEALGQRAMTNKLARLTNARYVMKVDAHCSFDQGFDRKMLEGFKETGDNVTMVPTMRNLHAFDWECGKCGNKWYQGPEPTYCRAHYNDNQKAKNTECDNTTDFKKNLMWIGKQKPESRSYCFDAEPHFQYFNECTKRHGWNADKKGLTETMSLQGSCFMMTREKYWELDICDEQFGNWGSQGIEVACKTWLSGGRVIVNHNTWYAHLFRTQPGFAFPWPKNEDKAQAAKKHARELFFENKWPKQVYPLSWLVERFWPVKGWSDAQFEELKKKVL